jgi:2,3-bisphosphoglycerate-dependent phosphoglycerate mutase
MVKLVLLRHGESLWNKENRFTGWTDVDLSEKGIDEAKKAGLTLKKEKYSFDIAYTSVLKRATRTLDIALEKMNQKIPIINSWRLNERHYGALQGLNKEEMAKKFGEEQVHIWRRSYDVRPPSLKKTDKMYPGNDKKYKGLSEKDLPLTECLKDTVKRVKPIWEKEILPQMRQGKKILIAAHGNSLRALVKIIDDVPDKEITELNIPTGVPLVYEFDKSLKAKKHYFLGDKKKIEEAMNKVAGQGKIAQKKK